MDYRGRRGRKGRGHSCINNPRTVTYTSPQNNKPWSFLNSICSFMILSSLIGVIYLMLAHHCSACSSNCDLNNISKSIEDIAKNLALMKKCYYDLELKISRFSHELPRIEGQIEILEALATAIGSKDASWDAKSLLSFPNVDVIVNKPPLELGNNVTKKCICPNPKPLPKCPAVN